MTTLHELPLEVLIKIGEYVPRDKDMRSPTAPHIRSLLHYYNYDYQEVRRAFEEYEPDPYNVPPQDEYYDYIFYEPDTNEDFYKYALRINKREKEDIEQAENRYYNDIINYARYYTSYDTDTGSDTDSDTSTS